MLHLKDHTEEEVSNRWTLRRQPISESLEQDKQEGWRRKEEEGKIEEGKEEHRRYKNVDFAVFG